MQIDWWTLGLQTVNVLVLLWLLQRFLFRPVAAIVAARQAAIAKLVDEARTDRTQAAAEKQTAETLTAGVAAGRGEALLAAAAQAEAEKAALLAAARTEADGVRAAAQADIARARHDEADAVGDRASRLAVEIAAKLLARLPDDVRVSGFVDGLAGAVAALPEATRADMGRNGAPVRLRAVRALTQAEHDACRARLGAALGRPVGIAVDIDPDLVAGLEIEAPHAVVRNSFRADLNRIAAALRQDGS